MSPVYAVFSNRPHQVQPDVPAQRCAPQLLNTLFQAQGPSQRKPVKAKEMRGPALPPEPNTEFINIGEWKNILVRTAVATPAEKTMAALSSASATPSAPTDSHEDGQAGDPDTWRGIARGVVPKLRFAQPLRQHDEDQREGQQGSDRRNEASETCTQSPSIATQSRQSGRRRLRILSG